MGCCINNLLSTDEQKYGVISDTPCGSISVELLRMFKRPIDCYIEHNLYGGIGSNLTEFQNASNYLNTFINQKLIDPENCSGLALLSIIRELVDKIVKKGVCL